MSNRLIWPVPSFNRGFGELLLHPDAVRIQRKRLAERFARVGVFLFFPLSEAKPQPGFGAFRIELQSVFEAAYSRVRPAAEAGRHVVVADAFRSEEHTSE